MLQKSTFKFLRELKLNNNKLWMDSNKASYQAAKADWENFVSQVLILVGRQHPELLELQASKCVFRQNRDVRFSKDKSPYKINMGASIIAGGKKVNAPGYYIHLEPDAGFIGGGFYMPEPAQLQKIRQEIDYNTDAFLKMLNDKKFKAAYSASLDKSNTLQRVPKGIDANHEAADYLKLKSFVAMVPLSNDWYLQKDACSLAAKQLLALDALISFLNTALID